VHLFLFLLLQFFLEFLALYSYLKTSCLLPFGRSPEGAEPDVFILIFIRTQANSKNSPFSLAQMLITQK